MMTIMVDIIVGDRDSIEVDALLGKYLGKKVHSV